MKSLILILAAFAVMTLTTTAQDMVKTNPKNSKTLNDTLGVRMTKFWLKPGEELVLHTHPVQQVYILKGDQLTVDHKDGKPDVYNVKAGDTFQDKEERPHTSKNTGKTDLEILLVEITPHSHSH